MRWSDIHVFSGPLLTGAAAAAAAAVRMGFEKLGPQGRNRVQVAKTLGNLVPTALVSPPVLPQPSPHAALADGTGIGIR